MTDTDENKLIHQREQYIKKQMKVLSNQKQLTEEELNKMALESYE